MSSHDGGKGGFLKQKNKMIKGGSHPYLTRVFFYTLSKEVIHISPPNSLVKN